MSLNKRRDVLAPREARLKQQHCRAMLSAQPGCAGMELPTVPQHLMGAGRGGMEDAAAPLPPVQPCTTARVRRCEGKAAALAGMCPTAIREQERGVCAPPSLSAPKVNLGSN